MKKGIIKACVLAAVFCIGILCFGQMTNHSNQDLTAEMADATLPLVSFTVGGEEGDEPLAVNELRGYTTPMNALYMRDAITPIGEDRILPVRIDLYDTKIDGFSYEIRSLDLDRLIVAEEVKDYRESGGKITAELFIQNLLEPNEEYLLTLKLFSGDSEIFYYTRIMEEKDCRGEDCVRFAMEFHEKTFDPEASKSLATYLEPNASGDNTTLHKVDIHSSLKQVAWADFEGERLREPIPSVKEINSSYTVVILNYLVSSKGAGGELEYYNIEEYYRIRYADERMYLLSYERTMEQIFRAENVEAYDNYIQLGIRDEEVEFSSNEKGTIVGFVQGGELWSYNETGNQLSQVFSFIGNEGIDVRENYGEHEIRIISVDETGSMNFVVYGYMNCGLHEGQVGICVYNYDSVSNTVEEELFIPSDASYQVMKADLGKLIYENVQGVFFLLLDGTLFRIDLADLRAEEFVTGLKEGMYAVSDSHKYFAWAKGETIQDADTVELLNLDMETRKEIKEGGGDVLRPLGFLDEDFVYGAARGSDLYEDAAGNLTVPMYQVKIVDSERAEVLKEYRKDGYFVSDIEIEDYIMYLERIRFNGTAYEEADRDTIMNREGDGAAVVGVHTTKTEAKQTQVQLFLAEEVKASPPKLLTPREVVLEESRELALERTGEGGSYYAYAKGDVLYVTDELKEAISAANAQMGVVIGNKQQYVWKRARKTIQPPIEVTVGDEDAAGSSVAQCVSAMLEQESINISVTALLAQGKTPKEILETTMENVKVLDLSGCALEEVLYYVSLGAPVFAMESDTEAVLVVGYDSQNVLLYDPSKGAVEKMGLKDAGEHFENAGNLFVGYILGK